jgi:hypothetical protein
MAKCTATTKAGDPCPSAALKGEELCIMHSRRPVPGSGRKKGGTNATTLPADALPSDALRAAARRMVQPAIRVLEGGLAADFPSAGGERRPDHEARLRAAEIVVRLAAT